MQKAMDMTRPGHRILPHTADVILAAWAPTFEECLAEAVAALTDGYADTSGRPLLDRHGFRLPARSVEQALVLLLEEALYVLDVDGGAVTATHLETFDGTQLSGWFEVADVDDTALVGSVPKGVAMSGLHIGRSDGGWRCTVTIDV